jgi:hypothetical protein
MPMCNTGPRPLHCALMLSPIRSPGECVRTNSRRRRWEAACNTPPAEHDQPHATFRPPLPYFRECPVDDAEFDGRAAGEPGKESSAGEHTHTVTLLVRKLVDLLNGRGLSAEPVGAAMVWVTNPAAGPPEGDARAVGMSPGLRQAVLCRTDGEGRSGWWWVWTAHDRSPDYEWICPAAEITTAADAIARVLALRPMPGDERPGR